MQTQELQIFDYEDLYEDFRKATQDVSPYLMEYMQEVRLLGKRLARYVFHYHLGDFSLTYDDLEQGIRQMKHLFNALHYQLLEASFAGEIEEILDENYHEMIPGGFRRVGWPPECDEIEVGYPGPGRYV